jgi:hypothetical protein
MTQLVEDITIKITLNHCEAGDSKVLGGKYDLRGSVIDWLGSMLPNWIDSRTMKANFEALGVEISFENTGLYEAPEVGGGDN